MTINQKAVLRMKENPLKAQHATKIHPAWLALMRHCRKVGFGEVERLKIQDGVPVMIETTIKRTKLT